MLEKTIELYVVLLNAAAVLEHFTSADGHKYRCRESPGLVEIG